MSVLETLDVGQANELKLAFRRNGWSNEEVKILCEGDALARAHNLLFPPKEVGGSCVAIVLSDTGEFTLQIPALSRLTLDQIQSRWKWVKRIEKDDSPTESVALTLATPLRVGEKSIDGAEYQLRLANQPVLGLSQAIWLEEHQSEFTALMALLGKAYIDFPATIAVSGADCRRRLPYLRKGGERFKLSWHWAGRGFCSFGRVARCK